MLQTQWVSVVSVCYFQY